MRAEKGQKWKKPLKISKTVFYKQILDFQCPSKILCHTSNLLNFVKITGPYSTCFIPSPFFIPPFIIHRLCSSKPFFIPYPSTHPLFTNTPSSSHPVYIFIPLLQSPPVFIPTLHHQSPCSYKPSLTAPLPHPFITPSSSHPFFRYCYITVDPETPAP